MSDVQRVLFVHAHPDDESISTGGTLATMTRRGDQVTVITCTRGERGEVIPRDLQYLLRSSEELADHREGELRDALGILGVQDHRYLGAADARWVGRTPRRYSDSGMVWGANGAERLPTLDPGCLAAAEIGEVASDIAAVINDIHPDVVVSYNEHDPYGHPDHVRASQAARRAADVYGIPFYAVEPAAASAAATVTRAAVTSVGNGANGAARESGDGTVSVDVAPVLNLKRAALTAHRTQVVVTGDDFSLSNGISRPIEPVERFRRIRIDYPEFAPPFASQSPIVRVLAVLVGVAVGVCVGAMLTIEHGVSFPVAGADFPVGVVAGVLIVAALLVGLRLVFGTRIIAGAAALGLLGAVALLSTRSSGGSILVPQDASGYVWAVAPIVVAIIALGWPQLPARPSSRHPRDTIVSSAK